MLRVGRSSQGAFSTTSDMFEYAGLFDTIRIMLLGL